MFRRRTDDVAHCRRDRDELGNCRPALPDLAGSLSGPLDVPDFHSQNFTVFPGRRPRSISVAEWDAAHWMTWQSAFWIEGRSLILPQSVLQLFPRSPTGLWELTRTQIDDELLRAIAMADYGDRADQHEAALRPIRDVEVPSTRLGWFPGEVLELMRYSEPDDPVWSPNVVGSRGHWVRAFCCAVLMASEIQLSEFNEAKLAQCLRSTRVLGAAADHALACFLTDAFPKVVEHSWDAIWQCACGLLILMTRFPRDRMHSQAIGELAVLMFNDSASSESLREIEDYTPFGIEEGYYVSLANELRDAAPSHSAVAVHLQIIADTLDSK